MGWKSLFGGSEKKAPAPAAPAAASKVAAPSTPMIFGKVPTRRDFLRLGAGCSGFERWLEDGLEAVRGRGGALPEGSLSFYVPGVAGDADVVGVMASSRDQVGRTFPLAVIRTLPRGPAADLAATWEEQAGFLTKAEGLIADADRLGEAGLAAGLEEIAEDPTEPGNDPLVAPARPLLEALLGSDNGPAHALATVAAACDAAKPVPGPDARTAAPITFDAPAAETSARLFWLLLAGRRLGWDNARPTVVAGKDRLAFALSGVAAPGVLAAYALGVKAGSRHWPLTTADAALRAKSAAGLAPALKSALAAPATTLADLAIAAGTRGR